MLPREKTLIVEGPMRTDKSLSLKDKRRRHHHWRVTVIYPDGGSFGRVYLDLERAKKFAARQRKSPVVKATRIRQLS